MAGPKPHLSNPSAQRRIRDRRAAYARAEKIERRELERELRKIRAEETDAALGT